MAYIDPVAKEINDVISAATLNAEIVENFKAGLPGSFTTKGQIAIGSGASAFQLLEVGANGTVLIPKSTAAEKWGYGTIVNSSVHARAHMTTDDQIDSVTEHRINFDTVDDDSTGSSITTGESWKWTATANGLYLLAMRLRTTYFQGYPPNQNVNHKGTVKLYKNGSLLLVLYKFPHNSQDAYQEVISYTTVVPLELVNGDYIYYTITVTTQEYNQTKYDPSGGDFEKYINFSVVKIGA